MLLFTFRFPWNTMVESKPDYDLLTDTTMTMAIVFSLVALLIAFVASQTIANKPDKSDFKSRKNAFITIGIITVLAFVVYNYFYVSQFIDNVMFNLQFSGLASFSYLYKMILLMAGIYFGIGILVSKLWKNNKFGTMFS
jgi:fumarate reductase subunit D